jgi:hypothetical protein
VKFGPCTYVEIRRFQERISNPSKQLGSECFFLQEWDGSGWLNEIDSPENDTHRIPEEPHTLISLLVVTYASLYHRYRKKNVESHFTT